MREITAIIVDDEKPARTLLEGYLAGLPAVKCLGSFHDPIKAFDFLCQNPVDLVLLDINMPKLSGLELSKNIAQQNAVIFTTAYSEFALEGFEHNAIDYLVKPISLERFLRAAKKAYQFLGLSAIPVAQKGFTIRVDGLEKSIDTEDIYYIQSFGNYLKIFTKTGMILAQETLRQAEDKLKAEGFLRCHRSYLVNTAYIQSFEDKLVLKDGQQLPVGSVFKRGIMDFMKAQTSVKGKS